MDGDRGGGLVVLPDKHREKLLEEFCEIAVGIQDYCRLLGKKLPYSCNAEKALGGFQISSLLSRERVRVSMCSWRSATRSAVAGASALLSMQFSLHMGDLVFKVLDALGVLGAFFFLLQKIIIQIY